MLLIKVQLSKGEIMLSKEKNELHNPRDTNLSSGQRYPSFKQPEPELLNSVSTFIGGGVKRLERL